MTQSIIAIEELRRLALRHALAVVEAEAKDGTGQGLHGELLREFQRGRQPFLSDKQYTALFRTYSDMVMTAVENFYAPGSAVEQPPVQVSSIKDSEHIYRPNAVAMSSAQWEAYLREVVAMAERFACEIADLAAEGGDPHPRMEAQQLEAAGFALDRGLNEEEMDRSQVIYKDALLQALKLETNKRVGE